MARLEKAPNARSVFFLKKAQHTPKGSMKGSTEKGFEHKPFENGMRKDKLPLYGSRNAKEKENSFEDPFRLRHTPTHKRLKDIMPKPLPNETARLSGHSPKYPKHLCNRKKRGNQKGGISQSR